MKANAKGGGMHVNSQHYYERWGEKLGELHGSSSARESGAHSGAGTTRATASKHR